MDWFAPSEETWAAGDREVTCYLTAADGKPTTVSYQALPSPSKAAP